MFDKLVNALNEGVEDVFDEEVIVIEEEEEYEGDLSGDSDVNINDVDDLDDEIDSELDDVDIDEIDMLEPELDNPEDDDYENEEEEDNMAEEMLDESLDDILLAEGTIDDEITSMFNEACTSKAEAEPDEDMEDDEVLQELFGMEETQF